MSSNRQDGTGPDPPAAVIVVDFPMPAGARFEWHTHRDHQLAWAARGVLTVVTGRVSFILPPTRSLWIPAGLRHETRSSGNAVMRALYIRPGAYPVDWTEPTPVAVSPLLAELIGYLDGESARGTRRARAEALLVDLLAPVPMATVDLRPPVTEPARTVARALVADPGDGRTLAEWGHRVGASGRTLARTFLAETGLTFGRWRTFNRLRAALPGLAAGLPVAAVARQVGFDTTSAFVAAFRREIGLTPGSYFRAGGASPVGRGR